jgi:hypothetical protein
MLIIKKSERILAQWIEREHQLTVPITMVIQAKVKSLRT